MNEEQSKLLFLGVGSGGGRLAAAVRARYDGEMRVLCMDTDALANREIQQTAETPCVLFGGGRLAGNGTGGSYTLGQQAFCDDVSLFEKHLAGVRTVVILTCLGGGTGSGATPEIARRLNAKGIATLCFATRPFSFESQARQDVASRMLPSIDENVDALVEVRLDDLSDETGAETLARAIEISNDLLASAVSLLWRMVARPGFISADPERLRGLIARGGNVSFGSATASGEHRVEQLTDALRGNRLLRADETLGKAHALLVGIVGGDDLRLTEIGGIMRMLRGWCGADCNIELGTVLDPAFNGRVELVVLAFESAVFPPEMQAGDPPVATELLSLSKSGKRVKKPTASKLSFGTTGDGKFQNVESTMWNNNNLDTPTYLRRKIQLER